MDIDGEINYTDVEGLTEPKHKVMQPPVAGTTANWLREDAALSAVKLHSRHR